MIWYERIRKTVPSVVVAKIPATMGLGPPPSDGQLARNHQHFLKTLSFESESRRS
jgi:hypothetical protein